MIQLHNSRQEEEGEQNHHGHGATAAAAGGDALSNNEHHHHHHHSRWTPGQGDASMSPTRLQFIRDTEMDANNRYTTPGAGDSSRSREQRHGTSQQIPLPPKHALDRIELLNQENRQTMEVPEYKEANPYRYMHDPDTDANFEFWDGIRQLTELQPHREYQSECAYCKRPGNNDRHAYGSIVERIQPEDYEAFLERGWMRSGRFLYLPISEKACCPNIPIRLDVTRFRAEKRHKQVLSRMHRYLEGKRPIFKLSGEKKSNDVDMGNSTENSGSSRKASGEAVLTAAISALIEHVLRTNEPTCDSICAQAYSELENSTIAHIIQALKDWKKHHLSGSAQPKLCNISPAKIRKNMGFLVSSPLALRIAQIVFREGSFDTSNHSSISLHVIRRVLAQTLVDWINKCTLCTQRFVCSMSSPGYLNFRLWNDQEQSSIEKAYSPASDLLADLRKMHSSISRFSPEPGATSNNNGNSGDPSTTRDNTHVDSRENSSCMQQPSSAIAAASEPTTPLIYHYTKFQREHFSSYGEGYEHRLKVRLTRPYYTDAHLELYVRYNTEIHDTEGKEQSKKSFMRHLVNSPIVFTPGMVQGRNTITCWPPRHDRSYHRSVPACSVHHPLDLYEPRHDVTENLQWKGKDLVWEQVPVELDSPPIHLIEFLSFMSQESHVRSFDDEDDDSCLEFPPVYRPRRNLLRWKHGLEDTHLRRLILRIFEADIQNFCPQASHFTFDSGYQPLERFKWLRTRYLKFMEERFLGLVSTANNPTALREAWEMVYEPDTLYLPSFVELATAYENISQGMRKIQSGLTAHRSIADNRRIDVTGSPLSRENYSDGRHMLGSYLDKDEFGNERDPEEEGWDLSMGYGTFFQEYVKIGNLSSRVHWLMGKLYDILQVLARWVPSLCFSIGHTAHSSCFGILLLQP